jgi:hypothetical protein
MGGIMSLNKLLEANSTFLTFQGIFKFSRISKVHWIATPEEAPRTFSLGPFGKAAVVLIKAKLNVFRNAYVSLSEWVG